MTQRAWRETYRGRLQQSCEYVNEGAIDRVQRDINQSSDRIKSSRLSEDGRKRQINTPVITPKSSNDCALAEKPSSDKRRGYDVEGNGASVEANAERDDLLNLGDLLWEKCEPGDPRC